MLIRSRDSSCVKVEHSYKSTRASTPLKIEAVAWKLESVARHAGDF